MATKAPTTKNTDTAKLPALNSVSTGSVVIVQSDGQIAQPWWSTTSAIAMPRSPSKTSTRRGVSTGSVAVGTGSDTSEL